MSKFLHRLYIHLCSLFLLAYPVSGQIPLNITLKGIELGVAEQYDDALALFDEYAVHYPHDPAPHFYMATIWQSKCMDFETYTWYDAFSREIDTTLALCDQHLALQPFDRSVQFYHASALAYKSFQTAREGKYIKGLQLALQAVKLLEKIVQQDSSAYDAYLGIGSYLYWRSYLTRHFSWLPFFHDSRDKGIALVQKSYQFGTISRWAALSNLAWIYIQEARYEDAIHCAQTGLAVFPNSRFFLWPAGDAFFLLGDFAAAQETYSQLLQSVTTESFNNGYNETVLHLKLAQCAFELGNLEQAYVHAKRVHDIQADESVQKRLKEKRKDADRLMAKIKKIHE